MAYAFGRNLLLSSVGFERLIDAFEQLESTESGGRAQAYPPYNIVKLNEHDYTIEVAVAGFTQDEIDITAEGNKQSAILNAEGAKTAAILGAEGEAQAAVLRAEGEAKARVIAAEAEAAAVKSIYQGLRDADPQPNELAHRYLQALPEVAKGDANKVWVVPAELTGALGRIAEGLGGSGS